MKKILVIESSPRHEPSLSRKITDQLMKALKSQDNGITFTIRDLAEKPVSHLSEAVIQVMFIPPEHLDANAKTLLAESNELVSELLDADAIIISTPMFNFTVPSVLKAWIDNIVMPHRTFTLGKGAYGGLLKGKTVYAVCAYGGLYSAGPRVAQDFLTPYLTHILGFVGIDDVRFIRVENTFVNADEAVMNAEQQVKAVVAL